MCQARQRDFNLLVVLDVFVKSLELFALEHEATQEKDSGEEKRIDLTHEHKLYFARFHCKYLDIHYILQNYDNCDNYNFYELTIAS